MGVADLGSSPLTRGKLHAVCGELRRDGLIPAHAGKTVDKARTITANRAHPRSRGENAPIATTIRPIGGSSPLTRGKQATHHGLQDHLGLIPAHAGKTWSPLAATTATWLIPAHAGKTTATTSTALRPRAHPRSRGENGFGGLIGQGGLGSSPLTRGKHSHGLGGVVRRGLIPAHAGKTSPLLTPPAYTRAHPRSRGENFALVVPMVFAGGSSPLTRGKPADASAGGAGGVAHPRSRGENRVAFLYHHMVLGSSPLTRGKLAHHSPVLPPGGLIPAHAGKTRPRRWL